MKAGVPCKHLLNTLSKVKISERAYVGWSWGGNSFIAEGSEQVKVVIINATSFVLTVESRKSNYVG